VAINTTVSAYSVLDIDRTVEYFLNLKQYSTGPLEHWFHLCTWPARLSPAVLKNDLAHIARQKLIRAVQLLDADKSNPLHSIETLKNTITLLSTASDELTDDFFKFTKQLDTLRGQNFETLLSNS
jgi:hypothetical protein